MKRSQNPIRSSRDEIYDISFSADKKKELKLAYSTLFESVGAKQATRLKRMLR